MSIAIIDAREWQNVFDLRTGEKMKRSGTVLQIAREILARHPYPGDVDTLSNQWVSDTALDLIEHYDPQLVFLTYAQQYFTCRFTKLAADERKNMFMAVFAEAERFVRKSGYTPIIVGTGNMTSLLGEINLCKLDGLALSSGWSAGYAGLHRPSEQDLAYIKSIPEVERIISRQEWISLFNGMGNSTCDRRLMPDYLITANPGWAFKTLGATLRKPECIPADNFEVPVHSPFGKVEKLTEIRSLIERNLPDKKIAVIFMEGVGTEHFYMSFIPCHNGKGWFYYETGEGQYLTITTGTHQVFAYPTGYRYFDMDAENKQFPFSGYFTEIPRHTIGSDFDGKSIAVGNRSMFMHMVFGADISIECFARNLYNQGSMAVIHNDSEEEKK